MKPIIILLSLIKLIEACTPSIAPIIPPPVVSPINLVSNPQLPPIAFQVDQPIPHTNDYSDEPVNIQKDSIIPLHNEKLKQRFSLFDMFRPLALPATTQPILINEKPVSNILINITISPPVNWTFCYPSCGVEDQAVDAGDAHDNAKDDVIEAVQSACSNAGVKCLVNSVELEYHPESVLIEDFGPYFDLSGNRYKISGNTVPYRINKSNPGAINSFVLPVIDYLAARKFVHISSNST
ncbi:hypothetical protein CAEBREN_22824 [Caenorhabditis brenneri]|uniref:SEA domain-containing protein n=1 Tax=Caenorhabditis brenneri TaxID=135651 RepID=G0M733_CAEBE|nr:hypothetical protein CAEBREN_22824 [Caenorhabditis brenneri]